MAMCTVLVTPRPGEQTGRLAVPLTPGQGYRGYSQDRRLPVLVELRKKAGGSPCHQIKGRKWLLEEKKNAWEVEGVGKVVMEEKGLEDKEVLRFLRGSARRLGINLHSWAEGAAQCRALPCMCKTRILSPEPQKRKQNPTIPTDTVRNLGFVWVLCCILVRASPQPQRRSQWEECTGEPGLLCGVLHLEGRVSRERCWGLFWEEVCAPCRDGILGKASIVWQGR
jgi:hypothetical protein